MVTKNLICCLIVSAFLTGCLPAKLSASEVSFQKAKKDKNPNYIFMKSREEIAYELFMYAMNNLGELKFINTYKEFLEAYKKALKTVYSFDR